MQKIGWDDRKETIGEISPDTVIWRYMDLYQLVNIIKNNRLFFCRADKFEDPFEGKRSLPGKEIVSLQYQQMKDPSLIKDLEKIWKDHARFHMINCWHRNEAESDAMWKLYGPRGIAIKSTFERLKNSIDTGPINMVYFGKIEYIDFKTQFTNIDCIPGRELLLFKQKCYEHEKELRAIITQCRKDSKGKFIPLNKPGVEITCCPNILIDQVYVSPISPKWHAEIVKGLLEKYGLKKEVKHSKLLKYPY